MLNHTQIFSGLKLLFSKLSSLLKLYLFNPFSYDKPIDERLIDLDKTIDQKYACENFNLFLSLYGLNPKSLSTSIWVKLWGLFWYACFLIGFIRTIFWLSLDRTADYKILVYSGDVTLIFRSLRKYLLSFILLMASTGFNMVYLFNNNPNIKW